MDYQTLKEKTLRVRFSPPSSGKLMMSHRRFARLENGMKRLTKLVDCPKSDLKSPRGRIPHLSVQVHANICMSLSTKKEGILCAELYFAFVSAHPAYISVKSSSNHRHDCGPNQTPPNGPSWSSSDVFGKGIEAEHKSLSSCITVERQAYATRGSASTQISPRLGCWSSRCRSGT